MVHDSCITHKQTVGVLLVPSALFSRTLKVMSGQVRNRHGAAVGLRNGSFSPEHRGHRRRSSSRFSVAHTHEGSSTTEPLTMSPME